MRVKLKGVVYETVEDAAKAFNLSPRTICLILCEGREDKIKKKAATDKRGSPKPFTIEGMTFPNQKAANDAFGLSNNFLTQAINRNSKKSLAKVALAARLYKERKE